LIGFDWSKIQWLVAAMLVGLGFGLQEIFANFVSGLIILLERPVRPGDTVTIGETSGEVLRIQMRATTIRDWDRKELIVPNKEIVTGRVVNWSLSDTTLRIVIPVGIAYGSDTELATEILSRIAAEHPKVLDAPKPQVIFSQFGASALVFELRVFVPHSEHSNRVTHELHSAIDRELRQAGIEMAFPQLDLRIRSVDPSVLQAATRGRAA
jgi:potassium efflux system protein